jgi:hypothetical protein
MLVLLQPITHNIILDDFNSAQLVATFKNEDDAYQVEYSAELII